MTELSGPWDEDAATAFLQGSTVPIRVATHRPDGSLWLVALWYRYREGGFDCATWANAHVVRYLRDDSQVGFDVSTNDPPYRGVRGNGTASLSPDADKAVLRTLVERYLGDAETPLVRWLLDDAREEVHVRIHPDAMHTWDYTRRMRGVEAR